MAQSSAATRIEQESQNLGIDERLWFDEQGNVVRREVDPQASGPRPPLCQDLVRHSEATEITH